jgi:hypothetical protein
MNIKKLKANFNNLADAHPGLACLAIIGCMFTISATILGTIASLIYGGCHLYLILIGQPFGIQL